MDRARGFVLTDLAEDFSDRRFDGFVRLYNQAFPDSDLREPPELWPDRLRAPADGGLRMHLLVAEHADSVTGGIVFEYYPASRCGLMTYVVVDPAHRGHGLGQTLVAAARERLEADAREHGHELAAVFAESESPEHSQDPYIPQRLAILQRLGFRWLRFPYLQPRLSPEQSRGEGLMALVLVGEGGAVPPPPTLRAFLTEFFRITEGEEPDDPAFAAMLAALPEAGEMPVTGLPQRARPSFRMEEAGIAFHVVRPLAAAEAHTDTCRVFGSFESDLLSYRFQQDPPGRSHCLTGAVETVEIDLPTRAQYTSEGRIEVLDFQVASVRARRMVSYTDYPRTGIRVWHIALRPAAGTSFSEYDLLRLARLRPSAVESVDLLDGIRFRAGDEREETFPQFLERVTGDADPAVAGITLDLVLPELPPPWKSWDALQAALAAARAGDATARAELDAVMESGTDTDADRRPPLCALVGLASGIFDFLRMDTGEVLDALAPTVSGTGFIRLHREQLVAFADESGVTGAVEDNVGVSPYLILPHAALIHNEHLLGEAEDELAAAKDERKLTELEARARNAAAAIGERQLPDIFHYDTERTLFRAGLEGRGLADGLDQAGRRLDALRRRIDNARDRQRRRALTGLAVLVGLVSVMEARDFIWVLLEEADLFHLRWWVLGGGTALLGIPAVVTFWRYGGR